MDDAIKYYRNQFFQEAREILDSANDNLLRIEADPENVEALNAIFRGIHTIKGSAGSFDLDPISDFAHHLENVLNRLREGRLELSPELVDVILSSLDQLNSLLEAIAAGNEVQASAKIVGDLQALMELSPGSPLHGDPTGEEAGLQTTSFDIEPDNPLIPTDVLDGLERDREEGLNIFKIETHYTSQHLAHGYDPLILIKNIKHKAARSWVPAATTAVPGINDFEPLDLYLSPVVYISTPLTAGDLADMAFDPDLITVTPLGLPPEKSPPGSSEESSLLPGLPEKIRIELKEFVDRGASVYRLDLHFTDEHLEHGYDLLVLLKNIRKLCPFYRVIETGPLPPPLGDFEPLHLYLNPSIIIAGRVTREQIEDLAFDPGLLSVTPIGPGAAGQSLTDSGLNIDPEDLEEFLVGSFELLDNLEKSAMIFESQGDLGSLNEIFRAVHTIKGDSDYLGLKELAVFSHALESMLEQLRNRPLKQTPVTVDILLQSADYLRQSINALRQGRLITDLPPIFDHLNTFSNQEAAQAESKTGSSGYDDNIGRAFIVQSRQQADLLQTLLKKDAMDQKDRRTLERGLAGLVKAATVVGLDSLQTLIHLTLSELALGDSPRFRDRAAEVLAFVQGLEEEPKRIGEILVEEGKITVQELRASLAQQKPLGAILVASGKVQEDDVNRALKKQSLMETAHQSRPSIATEPEVRTMRVDERKIDQFGNFVGELLVVRNTYEYLIKQLGDLDGPQRDIIKIIRENQHLLTRLTNDIHHGVMALRMIPIRGIFQRFQRVVRDISRKQKKDIQYITEGEELEIDKKVGDILADPLIHLIRNACDHGIETMADRKTAGKPKKASVVLRASQEGSNLSIRVMDDGRGIDRQRLYEKATRLGHEVSGLNDPNLLDCIFLPGLSTRDEVSEVSGRGVGMDVVKTAIHSLGGRVQVNSEEGRGTQVVLSIPMTMGVNSVLLVESAGTAYALPLNAVSETLKVQKDKIHRAGTQSVFHYRGRVMALADMTDLLNGGGDKGWSFSGNLEDDSVAVVIIESIIGKFGLMVDKLLGNMELAIKPVPPSLADIKLYSGVSLMGDGKVLFILNPDYLFSG